MCLPVGSRRPLLKHEPGFGLVIAHDQVIEVAPIFCPGFRHHDTQGFDDLVCTLDLRLDHGHKVKRFHDHSCSIDSWGLGMVRF